MNHIIVVFCLLASATVVNCMGGVPGQIAALEADLANSTSRLNDHIPDLLDHLEVARNQCLLIEKKLYRNMITAATSLDPFPLPVTQTLKILDPKQDSSNSVYDNAYRVVDGNTEREYAGRSCSHTASNTAVHWWQGKLEYTSTVERVIIYNRADCCGARLSNFRIEGFPYDPSGPPPPIPISALCVNEPGTVATAARVVYACGPMFPVTYIRLTRNAPGPALTLCEFIAEGTPSFDLLAVTYVQSSNQISEPFFGAWRADDNNLFTCTHTDLTEEGDPWWQVDLQEVKTVTSVRIRNRSDSKSIWMKQLVVTVTEDLPTCCLDANVTEPICGTVDGVVGVTQFVTVTCTTPISGRYVRITKTRVAGEALSVCEVDVSTL